MSAEEVARYVMTAYAVILAALVAYAIWQARRVSGLERQARLLSEELERREAAAHPSR